MYKGANDNCEIHKKQPTAEETLLLKGKEQNTFSELYMLRSDMNTLIQWNLYMPQLDYFLHFINNVKI